MTACGTRGIPVQFHELPSARGFHAAEWRHHDTMPSSSGEALRGQSHLLYPLRAYLRLGQVLLPMAALTPWRSMYQLSKIRHLSTQGPSGRRHLPRRNPTSSQTGPGSGCGWL